MKKILVIPNSLQNLGNILKTDIDGVILPIESLSVHSDIYFKKEDVKSILNLTCKEVCVSLNKIMHNNDLKKLEDALVSFNKMGISKIFFYDIAVMNICKRLGIKKELVVFQEHLNASTYSNSFYRKRGITYSVITNDITIEEVNEIAKKNKLMLICYGYLPMFYSRRALLTNYLSYIKKTKKNSSYYLDDDLDKYPIVEEESGTFIYTKDKINLINDIENISVDYIILNAFHIDNKEFMDTLKCYLENKTDNNNYYKGLMDKKTVYKVEDYE